MLTSSNVQMLARFAITGSIASTTNGLADITLFSLIPMRNTFILIIFSFHFININIYENKNKDLNQFLRMFLIPKLQNYIFINALISFQFYPSRHSHPLFPAFPPSFPAFPSFPLFHSQILHSGFYIYPSWPQYLNFIQGKNKNSSIKGTLMQI